MALYYGLARFESVDVENFTYMVCAVCCRKPGSNVYCRGCQPGGREGGGAASQANVRPAYALRATVSVGNGLYRVILFDSAATKLIGYSAEKLEHLIEKTLELEHERQEEGEDIGDVRDGKADSSILDVEMKVHATDQMLMGYSRRVIDGREIVSSNIRGTVVLCELQNRGGTDLHMKLHSVISKPPPRQGLSMLEKVLNGEKAFKPT